MEKDVHGIKGNIYCQAELNKDEQHILDVIEKIVFGAFCVCGIAVIIAQLIIHFH